MKTPLSLLVLKFHERVGPGSKRMEKLKEKKNSAVEIP